MAKPTKQYIAEKALLLFNERGYASVRLQHIADAAFVSVGHLAYHFQNKEGLLDHLFELMSNEKQRILLEHKVLPLFEDIQQLWVDLFQHQQQYRFFYTDALEVIRGNAEMAPRYAEQASWQVVQYDMMIRFNVARAALHVPEHQIVRLAQQLQHYHDSALTTQLLHLGTIDPKRYYQNAWFLLEPWFSDTGKLEFNQGPGREFSTTR